MALYIISTPIGNRKDMTKRALETIAFCRVLLCEDTRKTDNLLDYYQMEPKPKLIPFYEENASAKLEQVVGWLKSGREVGLVSNAGTPTISDPGFKLVRRCRQESITVKSVPGPIALIAALSVSGLPTDKFCFLGFLPKSTGKKKRLFEACRNLTTPLSPTFIFYESPHRLIKTLKLMKEIYSGEIDLTVARELTKVHEETINGSLEEVLQKLSGKKTKGEVTVVFEAD